MSLIPTHGLLNKGHWLGKGKLLVEGATQGPSIEIDLTIDEDREGMTLTGHLEGDLQGELSIRVAADEVGTYVIDAIVAKVSLDGVGKLESEPNLALLWNQGHTQSASVALFRAASGVGCRGFFHEDGRTRTWEILFQLKQQVVGGDNVVSLARRRR
ncbi:MAG: hypothetical protein AAF513_15645 [Pseudomonadota bacterium]